MTKKRDSSRRDFLPHSSGRPPREDAHPVLRGDLAFVARDVDKVLQEILRFFSLFLPIDFFEEPLFKAVCRPKGEAIPPPLVAESRVPIVWNNRFVRPSVADEEGPPMVVLREVPVSLRNRLFWSPRRPRQGIEGQLSTKFLELPCKQILVFRGEGI